MVSSSRKGEAKSFSRLILVTGGARAGKSRFAKMLAEKQPSRRRLFVATAVGCDPEMKARIANHRRERNGDWKTLEEPTELPKRLPAQSLRLGSVILLDCLPTFATNLLMKKHSAPQVLKRVRKLLRALKKPGVTAIFVTNEVGLGIVPDHPLGREFRDLLGAINQEVANRSDEVYLMVSGIPMRLK